MEIDDEPASAASISNPFSADFSAADGISNDDFVLRNFVLPIVGFSVNCDDDVV